MSEHKDKNRIHVETAPKAESAAPPSPSSESQAKQAPAADPPSELARLQAEKDELMQTMVRRQADFENYRKRVERERQEDFRRGTGKVIEDLLAVVDGLERAVKAYGDPAHEEYRKGIELMHRQLWEILARHGLERIDAAGKMFDPHFHQAIERVETSDYPDGAVVDVIHDGYLYQGRVLRPALVRVAANGEEHHSAAERGAQR